MNNTNLKPRKYICDKCDFRCDNNKDYNRHLLTAKHICRTIRTEKTPKKTPTRYDCECGKIYKSRSSLWYHNKKCSHDTKTVCLVTEENTSMLDLLSQNKELMELLVLQNREHKNETRELIDQNKQMHKTIQDIIPKIGNNNNSNNNTTQFNLQVFLNEECKDALNFSEFIETIKVSFSDLENQAENGYVKGISKLFIESLQSLGVNKRPIHCTDKKRKTLYVKENDTWDKEGSQDILKKGIQQISGRTFEEFVKSKEDNAEEYKDADSEFSEKCLLIQRNLVPTFPRETTINKVIENITQSTGIIEK